MTIKKAATDHPILQVLAERWSPYWFENRPVSEADLRSLFEAARWAASSYNEQLWNYLVATRENSQEFGRLLSCLVEANQAWAKAAPVLDLGVVNLRFAKNNQDNRAAIHCLGLAAGNLVAEATARGLSVHQMIGILPDKAREAQAKWQYGRRYLNQMISAAQVFNHLGVFSSLNPDHQSQVQPLSGLTPEQAQSAWQYAVENAGGRRITARMVNSAVNHLGLGARRTGMEQKHHEHTRRPRIGASVIPTIFPRETRCWTVGAWAGGSGCCAAEVTAA